MRRENFRSAGKRASGVWTDEDGEHEVADTVQCAHCSQHFVLTDGKVCISVLLPDMTRGGALKPAKIWREPGFCFKCNAQTCGGPNCCECVPFEKKLEEFEARKRRTLIFPDPNQTY